jgi:DNA primase
LADPVEREHYEKKIASMVGSSLEAVREKLAAAGRRQEQQLKPITRHPNQLTPTYDHVDTVLGLALMSSGSHGLFAGLDTAIFGSEARGAVVRYLGTEHPKVTDTPKELQKFDDYVKIILLRAEKRYGSWAENDQQLEIAKLLRQYKSEYEKQRLEKQIQEAEHQGDNAEVERLRTKHYELIKEIKRGQR